MSVMSTSVYVTPTTTTTSASVSTTTSKYTSKNASKLPSSLTPPPYIPIGTPNKYKLDHNNASFNILEWPHAGPYRGKIIFLHGFGEHAAVYTEFHDMLSQAGFEVFFYEQRGSGDTSWGTKNFGKTDGIQQIDDLDFMVQYNRDRRFIINERFHLMGHSMGGAICLDYAIKGKHRDLIKSVTTCAPTIALHPDKALSPVVSLLKPVINKCVPNYKVMTSNYYDPTKLTSSEKWQKYLTNYERDLHVGTTRFFYDIFKRGEELNNRSYVKNFPSTISLLLLHGQNDTLNWIDGSRKFYSMLGEKVKKEYVEIPGGKNALFIEKDEILNYVFSKVVDFMNDNHY